MVRCTEAAARTLTPLRDQKDVPPTFGLRVSADGSPNRPLGLRIAFTAAPAAGDEVTEQHGQLLFIAPDAAESLGDMELDAQQGDGGPSLVLRPADRN
jgi:Fe-S cluster assembly iron-binding protein IscA